MGKKIIITISWLLVIIWMGVIFFFSHMTGPVSEGRSRNIVKKAITTTAEITDKKPTPEKVTELTETLDYPFRKALHIGEYLILTLLLMNAFYQSNIIDKRIYIFSIIISFLYACTDEYHQLFVQRTGMFQDVLIDSIGIVIAISLYIIFTKIKKKPS